jgi:hypothetical protein
MPPDDERDYEVGYGKPPRHTRFELGRSGNPRGRPGGSKNMSTLLSEALKEPVIVVENGRRRKIAKRQAIITQLDLPAGGAVEDRVRHHRHRLHRRVQRQQIALRCRAGEGVGPGIAPDIAAVAAELAELDVVAVRPAALFEDEDELVLAAVERAHAGVVLDPNADIFELAIGFSAGGQQFVEVAPVHADVVQRSAGAEGGKVAAGPAEKSGERGFVHLARSHRKRTMVDCAEAARMALDRHVVGWVGEDHGGAVLAHQRCEDLGIEGVAAHGAMMAEEPQIADLADRRLGRDLGHGISRVVIRRGHLFEGIDPQIDLAHLEAGNLEAEIEPERSLSC